MRRGTAADGCDEAYSAEGAGVAGLRRSCAAGFRAV